MKNFKDKLKSFKLKDHKIKLAVLLVLTCLWILSFFFAGKIEGALGLNSTFDEHQTTYASLSSSEFLVEYIDVGQGNCTLILLPDGKSMLVDGGNTQYGKVVADFIESRGVTQIDYLIASHADSDHIGGINYVLDAFEVKNILRPFQISGTGSSAATFVANEYEDLAEIYEFLQESTNNRSKISRVTTNVYNTFIEKVYTETYTEDGFEFEAAVTVFYDGLIISGEGYEIEFYAPLVRDENLDLSDFCDRTTGFATMGYGTTNSNDCSAIFTLRVAGEVFLFTGDAAFTNGSGTEIPDSGYLEIDFVNSLTDEEIVKLSNVSVFLAGHHGSKYSSGEALLLIITPKFCVVSVGENNSYGHPTEEALLRLEKYKTESDQILITSSTGTISFGMVDGTLMYVLQAETEASSVKISWYLLSTIIYAALFAVIVSAERSKIVKDSK